VAIGRMTPLNASDVIWLSGTGDEISVFLKSSEVRDKAVVLGHPKDAKRMLELHIAPGPIGMALSNLYRQESVEICFLLMQGKIIGLIKEAQEGGDRV